MGRINIYYQSDMHGKEIADSIGRYLKYLLSKNITKIEMNVNIENIQKDPTDFLFLLFTNLTTDITYWGEILGRIIKDINNKKCQLKIIDLTFQKNFPIVADSDVIVSCNSSKDWLSKVIIEEVKLVKIKLTKNYLDEYYAGIDH